MVFVIRFITARLFEDDEYGFKEPFEASMRDLQALMTEFGAHYQCHITFAQLNNFPVILTGGFAEYVDLLIFV